MRVGGRVTAQSEGGGAGGGGGTARLVAQITAVISDDDGRTTVRRLDGVSPVNQTVRCLSITMSATCSLSISTACQSRTARPVGRSTCTPSIKMTTCQSVDARPVNQDARLSISRHLSIIPLAAGCCSGQCSDNRTPSTIFTSWPPRASHPRVIRDRPPR